MVKVPIMREIPTNTLIFSLRIQNDSNAENDYILCVILDQFIIYSKINRKNEGRASDH